MTRPCQACTHAAHTRAAPEVREADLVHTIHVDHLGRLETVGLALCAEHARARCRVGRWNQPELVVSAPQVAQ